MLLQYTSISWTDTRLQNDSTNTTVTVPAWVGFSAGDGVRHTSVTVDFSLSTSDLSSASNVNQSGLWVFRVDGNSTGKYEVYPGIIPHITTSSNS